MLDLSFVRANLELVEAKLRARGADPAALLGDFKTLDQSRRAAITQSEQAKARRNELSQQVGARLIEAMPMPLGIVATDLQSGEPMLFRRGSTGTAVRASSAVPGVFQPVRVGSREYVDGGLSSPVPVRFARQMGATFVIAVDISDKPTNSKLSSTFDILMQAVTIMGQSITRYELPLADVVIRPNISQLNGVDFATRHNAVLEGEKAAALQMPALKAKLASLGTP